MENKQNFYTESSIDCQNKIDNSKDIVKDAQKETKNKEKSINILSNPGSYPLNPESKFHPANLEYYSIDLQHLRTIEDLEKTGYSVRNIAEEAILKTDCKFFTEEMIYNLLAYGKNFIFKGDEPDEKGRLESHIFRGLKFSRLITPELIQWILDNDPHPSTLVAMAEKIDIPGHYLKTALFKCKKSYVKNEIAKLPSMSENAFSLDEVLAIINKNDNLIDDEYLIDPVDDSSEINQAMAKDIEVAQEYLYSLLPDEHKEKLIQKFKDYYFKLVNQDREVWFGNDCLMKHFKEEGRDPEFEYNQRQWVDKIRLVMLDFPERLSTEDIIKMIDAGRPDDNNRENWKKLPGWMLYGFRLKYNYSNFDDKIIEDMSPSQEHLYKLIEERFLKEPIAEMPEAAIQKAIVNVKEYGEKIFEPIVPADSYDENTVLFTHISSLSNLKCLLPAIPRNTDRQQGIVCVQRGSRYEYENRQKQWLAEVNGRKFDQLNSYSIYITQDKIDEWLDSDGDRWRNGYKTSQPILLDKDFKLTWDKFDQRMKNEAMSSYEYAYGTLPLEVKKRLK